MQTIRVTNKFTGDEVDYRVAASLALVYEALNQFRARFNVARAVIVVKKGGAA